MFCPLNNTDKLFPQLQLPFTQTVAKDVEESGTHLQNTDKCCLTTRAAATS